MNLAVHAEATSVLAASFPDIDSARIAAVQLKAQNFEDIWIGVTSAEENERFYGALRTPADVRLKAENWFERFFGQGDETLHSKLVRRGINSEELQNIDYLPLNSAVLTVADDNRAEEASSVIRSCGGKLLRKSQSVQQRNRQMQTQTYDGTINGGPQSSPATAGRLTERQPVVTENPRDQTIIHTRHDIFDEGRYTDPLRKMNSLFPSSHILVEASKENQFAE